LDGSYKSTNKKREKREKKEKDIGNIIDLSSLFDFKPIKKKCDKYNVVGKAYLKYIDQIDGEDNFLTFKFAGTQHCNKFRDKSAYNLILLPYKNKQNVFKVHLQDYLFLKPFYEKYGLYNITMKDTLNKIIFATSDYNINKEQYLELEKTIEDENIYLIKASIWYEKGPLPYLHIDDKNKLYFDQKINQNVAKFVIV